MQVQGKNCQYESRKRPSFCGINSSDLQLENLSKVELVEQPKLRVNLLWTLNILLLLLNYHFSLKRSRSDAVVPNFEPTMQCALALNLNLDAARSTRKPV